MNYLITAVVIIVVTLLLNHLRTFAVKKPAVDEHGTMVLKYPGLVAGIGYMGIGFGALCGIVTVFQLIPTTGDEVVPYLVAFFVMLGLPLVLLEKNVRIRVSDETVRYTGFTKKIREVRWEDVRSVTLSFTSEIVLDDGSTRIKLNTELAGFEGFMELMMRKLEPGMYEKAVKAREVALKNARRR